MSEWYASAKRRRQRAVLLLSRAKAGHDYRTAERRRLAEVAVQRAGEPARHVTRLADVELEEGD